MPGRQIVQSAVAPQGCEGGPMFMISMPKSFSLGDRAEVRINKQSATLFWRDAHTLVINETDPRRILRIGDSGALWNFMCSDPLAEDGRYVVDGPLVYRED